MTWYLYHIFFQIHIQSERRKSGLSTYLWDQEGQGEQGPHKDHDESLGEGSTQGKAEEGGHLISRPKVGGTTSSCHTLQLQDVTSFDSLTVASALEASSDSLTVATAQEVSSDSLEEATVQEASSDSLTVAIAQEASSDSLSVAIPQESSFDSLTVAIEQESSCDSLTENSLSSLDSLTAVNSQTKEDSLDFYTEEESFVDSLTEGLVEADDNSTEIENNVSDNIELAKTFGKYIEHKEAISSSTEEAVISNCTEEAVISSFTEEAVINSFIKEKEASESSQLFSEIISFPVESVR